MSDMKSKFPDFKELVSMTGKLYGDIKTSVGQIIQDYKDHRTQSVVDEQNSEAAKPEVKTPTHDSKTEDNKN